MSLQRPASRPCTGACTSSRAVSACGLPLDLVAHSLKCHHKLHTTCSISKVPWTGFLGLACHIHQGVGDWQATTMLNTVVKAFLRLLRPYSLSSPLLSAAESVSLTLLAMCSISTEVLPTYQVSNVTVQGSAVAFALRPQHIPVDSFCK